MRAGLKKYWCEWCRLWPLLHTWGIVLGGTKICHHSHPKALDVMNRGFSALCTFSTSHNRLYHQIEKRRAACVFVHNTSIYHPQPGRLATHWQGRVPLRRTPAKDKASKQNRLHRYKRRKLPRAQDQCRPGQDETLRGGERERLNAGRWRIGRRQDNPAAATAGLPREGEQGSGESQINLLALYFSFITCLSAIAESIHKGGSKQISLFAHQKGDYIYPFPLSEKVEARWKCVWERKLSDEPMSDWGSRKRGFSVSLSNSVGGEPDLLMGNIKTTRPW